MKVILGVICLVPIVAVVSAFVWLTISTVAERCGWPFALVLFPGALIAVAGLYKGMELLSDL